MIKILHIGKTKWHKCASIALDRVAISRYGGLEVLYHGNGIVT